MAIIKNVNNIPSSLTLSQIKGVAGSVFQKSKDEGVQADWNGSKKYMTDIFGGKDNKIANDAGKDFGLPSSYYVSSRYRK